MGKRIVIIGGGAAGMSAAAKARRTDPTLTINVYERGGYVSYGACGFPYLIKGEIAQVEDVVARTPEEFAKQDIMTHLHHEVLTIDAHARTAQVRDVTSGKSFAVEWDELLLTSGGAPVRPPLPGIDLSGVFVLRSVEDTLAIQAWLDEHQPARGVIVGGGYIGLELAEALAARGVALTLVEKLPQVLPNMDQDMAAHVQEELAQQGVTLRLGQEITALDGDERVREVVTDDGRIPADIVIMSVGLRPGVELARAAGLVLGPTGAVAVDDHQRTSVPHVWAAGDVAEAQHRVTGRPAWVPLGTTANKQGKVAGTNLGGGDARFSGIVGTSVVKVFDIEAASSGLSSERADAEGYTIKTAQATSSSRADYMPGDHPIHSKLIYEAESRRLLGGQLVGREGVAKRIDVIAAALQAGWTIDELAELDLSYAPPFAPVWDVVLVAANLSRRS